MNTTTTEARIYVGTYHKYNCGSLHGAWLDLADYSDATAFYDACLELHADEDDPELMFQDWEGIPSQFVGESHISPEFWEYLQAVEDSGLDPEIWEAADELGIEWEKVEEAYRGSYDSERDFAEQQLDEMGVYDLIPAEATCAIDPEGYWLGNLQHYYLFQDGHIFSRDY